MQVNGQLHPKLKRVSLVCTLILIMAFSGAVEAAKEVKISGGAINFHIKTKPSPDEQYIYTTDVLTLEWKDKADRENIYFEATELFDGEAMLPPESIEAATSYSGYQRLDTPILFLKANEDKLVEVSFRLSSEAWSKAGNFHGSLIATDQKGNAIGGIGPINIHAHVHKYTCLDVDAGEDGMIVVDADRGPGMYEAERKIGLTVTTNTQPWILAISSEYLRLSSESDSSPIPPENIWVRLDGSGEEANMAEGLVLSGPAGKVTRHELAVKVKTELEHISGIYKGKLKLTLSE